METNELIEYISNLSVRENGLGENGLGSFMAECWTRNCKNLGSNQSRPCGYKLSY